MNNTHYINGQWVEGDGAVFDSINPYDQKIIWSGCAASNVLVNRAVSAAAEAQKDWFHLGYEQRLQILKKYQAILSENSDELAALISCEVGKPLWEASTEISAMIGKVGLSEKAYLERTSERQSEIENGAAIAKLKHKPHGVIAVYGPYNFPGHLPNGHIVPALLLAPAFAQAMVNCFIQAGIPEGVVNLLQGESDTGKLLSRHPFVDGLLFTGSSQTGAILHKQFAGDTSRMLALEMGGNNPLIIHDVNDEKAAILHIIQSAYVSSGQRCTCARRLIVTDEVSNTGFIDRFVDAVRGGIVAGDPMGQPAPYLGTVVSEHAANDLMHEQQKLLSLGAKEMLMMKQDKDHPALLSPGLLDVTQLSNLPDQEYFGPLLQLIRVSDLSEAITVANQTRYGLSAGIISQSKSVWEQFYEQINAGIVNWNRPLTGASGAAPFGGIGASGNHRPSAYYAADYCAYPVASMEGSKLVWPDSLPKGVTL